LEDTSFELVVVVVVVVVVVTGGDGRGGCANISKCSVQHTQRGERQQIVCNNTNLEECRSHNIAHHKDILAILHSTILVLFSLPLQQPTKDNTMSSKISQINQKQQIQTSLTAFCNIC
jgi:hypothetical protein